MYHCIHYGYSYSDFSSLFRPDLSVEQVQPDVEETDLGEEVVQQREEERQEEEEAAPSPVEQVEVEHSHELEAKQDEPEDEQAEPEDTPEITPAEPEEVEEEEIAEEPSAVQEHEPYQEEEQEEYPPADEAETHEAAEEEPESKKTEPEPEKKELGARRRMQPQGEVRKDKKGPEQVDFRNVLRKTENPATVIASSTFYKSGSKQVHTCESLWHREGGLLPISGDMWFNSNLIGVQSKLQL